LESFIRRKKEFGRKRLEKERNKAQEENILLNESRKKKITTNRTTYTFKNKD